MLCATLCVLGLLTVAGRQMYPPTNATGVTERITLVLSRDVLSGHNRPQVLVNGSVPGPTLVVQVGDVVEVTVINRIHDDFAVVHWHGLGMRGHPAMDGTVNFTQCPISNIPGNNTFLYRFVPDMPGTYWYHGHINAQYVDGLYGTVVVQDGMERTLLHDQGAAYTNDDPDWVLMVADYYLTEARVLQDSFLKPGSFALDPIPDSITVNNAFSEGFSLTANFSAVPRVRVVNAAAYSVYRVSVDGLQLQLIELDGSPVKPVWVDSIKLFAAQRASFLLHWRALNQSVVQGSPAVWIRFELLPFIYPTYDDEMPYDNMFGSTSKEPLQMLWRAAVVLRPFIPSSSQPTYDYTPVFETESDMNYLNVEPLINFPVPPATHLVRIQTKFYLDSDEIVRGYINEETFGTHAMIMPHAEMHPLLYQVLGIGGVLLTPAAQKEVGESASGREMDTPSSPSSRRGRRSAHHHHRAAKSMDNTPQEPPPTYISSLISLEGDGHHPFILPFNRSVDIFIDGQCCGVHPFHMHGHHFWVIATNERPLLSTRPLVRDVVTVPFGGWALLRIVTDNPGVWLIHCHLHWHFAIGLAAVMVEAPDQLRVGYVSRQYDVSADALRLCTSPALVSQPPYTAPSEMPFTQSPWRTAVPSARSSATSTVHVSSEPSLLQSPSIFPSLSPSLVSAQICSPTSSPLLSPLPSLPHTLPTPPHQAPSLLPSLPPSRAPSLLPFSSPQTAPLPAPTAAPSPPIIAPSLVLPAATPFSLLYRLGVQHSPAMDLSDPAVLTVVEDAVLSAQHTFRGTISALVPSARPVQGEAFSTVPAQWMLLTGSSDLQRYGPPLDTVMHVLAACRAELQMAFETGNLTASITRALTQTYPDPLIVTAAAVEQLGQELPTTAPVPAPSHFTDGLNNSQAMLLLVFALGGVVCIVVVSSLASWWGCRLRWCRRCCRSLDGNAITADEEAPAAHAPEPAALPDLSGSSIFDSGSPADSPRIPLHRARSIVDEGSSRRSRRAFRAGCSSEVSNKTMCSSNLSPTYSRDPVEQAICYPRRQIPDAFSPRGLTRLNREIGGIGWIRPSQARSVPLSVNLVDHDWADDDDSVDVIGLSLSEINGKG